jgi:hypothetical protein
MMRPIARIPLEIDSPPLHTIVHGELKSLGAGESNPSNSMGELLSHCDGNDEHLQLCMDWAMQIRSEMGIDWGSAIEAAMVLYFG